MIEILVPGEAKSERKRQRFIHTKTGATVGHRTDEPDRADHKASIRHEARAIVETPLPCPLEVTIIVRKPKPASTPKRPTKTNPWPWAWWKKPDCSNFTKLIEDALNKVAWEDDAQIIDLHVHKRFGEKHETVIRIDEAQEGTEP